MVTKSRVIGYVDVNKILFIFSLKTSRFELAESSTMLGQTSRRLADPALL